MKEIRYENGQVKAYGKCFEVDNNLVGFFLANIPFLILGPGKIWSDLGPKAARAQTNAEKLLEIGGMSELATLETYLLMEMGLRCSYSLWLGKKAEVRQGQRVIEVQQADYRKVKLQIKLKHLKQPVIVKGERFPYSEAELLRWGERFMDTRASLAFRLSMNVRNLLAHGEVEWDLIPTREALASASQAVHDVFKGVSRRRKWAKSVVFYST